MSKRTIARARLHAQERKMEQSVPYAAALSAQSRGYKMMGCKLLPRDAYDAFEAAADGKRHRSRKELAVERRKELEAYGPNPYHTEDAHWRPMQRAMAKLNTRARKAVERVLWAESVTSDPELYYPTKRLSRAQLRAIRAAEYAEGVERAIDYDARMLANAY